MTDIEFSALIEQFNEINIEAKKKEVAAKALAEQIKEEFKQRATTSFITQANLIGKIIPKTSVAFDEALLVNFLKVNSKQYLIKEVPILDAVKLELKNKLIEEASLLNIISKKEVISLTVNEAKD